MEKQMIQQLYEAYGKEIFLYLYSLCRDRELSEDLLQETFVKALLSLSGRHANMRAWLYLVARNLYLNAAKKEKHKAEHQAGMEAGARQEVLQGQSILDEVVGREQDRMLYRALQKLPPLKREVLQLQYFSGMPLREVAAVLQISPVNARVLSHRAKREAKKYLEEEGYEIS